MMKYLFFTSFYPKIKKIYLMMKLFFTLSFAVIFQLLAMPVIGQNTVIRMEAGATTIGAFINEIEKQTDYLVVFSNQEIDPKEKLVLSSGSNTVSDYMNDIFKGTDVQYVFDRNYIILTKKVLESNMAQGNLISGTVTDESSEPIPGVNVVIKGSTTGVITDASGKFSINVPNKEVVLQFSFIGYISQEIPVGNQMFINVSLAEDTREIEEVVVVGYGVMRKKDITGAMTSIPVEKIDKAAIKSVDQMLQGRSSGLYMNQNSGMPGAGSTIRIRGGNSISGGNEPLYVIDGIPIYPGATGNQTDINPLNTIVISDIQSIEVLKDASSTAIYGARGANGVILITTKQGVAGRTNVSLDAYWGLQNVRKKYDLLNAKEFEEYANDAFVRGGGGALFDLSKEPINTDWQELCINPNALMQNYTLSVSGGEAKTRFLTTLNYMDQDGIIKGSEMQKITLRANLDRDISSTIRMGLNLSLAQVNTNRLGNNILGYRLLQPNLPVKDANGNYNTINPHSQSGTFTNPMLVLRDQVDDNKRFRTINNIYADWQIIQGLTFRTTFGVDIQFADQNTYVPLSIPDGLKTKGDATINSSSDYMWVNENTLTYIKSFGKHRINAMAALTQQSSKYEGATARSQGFLNDNLQMWDMGSGTVPMTPSSGANQWSLLSYLGRINYNFNEKYLITASIRADGSSRFGRNNRWAYFPSAAVAWRASEEEFIKSLDIFSNLKLRASHGWTGNQDGIGVYPSMALLGKKTYSLGTTKYMGYAPTQVSNYNLKWETTQQSDIGIEMGFFKNRLNFSADFYYKTTHDLLLQVQIPSTSGYRSGLKNIGEVENKGVELSVNSTPVDRGFRWDLDFNISFNKNKVVSLGKVNEMIPANSVGDGYGTELARLLRVGEPLGIFYGYLSDGVFSTTDDIAASAQPSAKPGDIRYVDLSGPDGVKNNSIEESDRVVLGSAQPKFFGGLNNTFSYKGFDLNIFMVFSYGNKIYNATKAEMENLTGWDNQTRAVLNRWTETNQNTNIPRAVDIKPTSRSWDHLVEDGSFLRIQNINLGYSLPKKLLEASRILQSARLYVSLQNFITFTNYSGLDPEVSRYGQTNIAMGYDYVGYPMSKTVLFGVNVNF